MCNNVCQYLFCLPQKKLLTGTGNSSQTVWNDLDCFKLSKWSDESPLMARPLRLLFYLGLFLSIQTALPMHKVHNTIQYSFLKILYILYYLPTILFCDTQSSTQSQIWDVPQRVVRTYFELYPTEQWAHLHRYLVHLSVFLVCASHWAVSTSFHVFFRQPLTAANAYSPRFQESILEMC